MKSEEAMRNLTCGDLAGTDESWNWGNYLINTRFMCLLDLFQGLEEAIEIAYTFWGIIVGGFKYGKMRWLSKEEILYK